MHMKSLAMLCGLLLATPALADITNTPDPYAAGYGFDTPTEATWGGWTRGDAGTSYAEWDTFDDSSYAGTRTAAPDVGSSGVTDVYAGWNSGTFKAGSGNLYSFSVIEEFSFNLTTDTAVSGPMRAVLQTEGWGVDIDPDTVLLNGVAPTSSELTHTSLYASSFGEVDLIHRLFVWDMASAPGNYAFTFASDGHSLSLAQVAVDIAPVPEPETYAMMLTGLAAVGLIVRRRQRAERMA